MGCPVGIQILKQLRSVNHICKNVSIDAVQQNVTF